VEVICLALTDSLPFQSNSDSEWSSLLCCWLYTFSQCGFALRRFRTIGRGDSVSHPRDTVRRCCSQWPPCGDSQLRGCTLESHAGPSSHCTWTGGDGTHTRASSPHSYHLLQKWINDGKIIGRVRERSKNFVLSRIYELLPSITTLEEELRRRGPLPMGPSICVATQYTLPHPPVGYNEAVVLTWFWTWRILRKRTGLGHPVHSIILPSRIVGGTRLAFHLWAKKQLAEGSRQQRIPKRPLNEAWRKLWRKGPYPIPAIAWPLQRCSRMYLWIEGNWEIII